MVRIYVFSDSLTPDQASKLRNGSQPLNPSDFPGIPAPVPISDSDTSWQIPVSFLDGRQGKNMRTDVHYRFAVWVQYSSGPTGPAPYCPLYFGDDIPPLIPAILDSEGQTYAVLRFARPRDQINDFDTLWNGPLRSVKALWWPGGATDSAGHVSSVQVSADSLKNPSVDSFRLVLSPLKYWSQYSYVLQAVDTAGNISPPAIPFLITTFDSLPPAAPDGFVAMFARTDSVAFRWFAASDTFQSDSSARRGVPNYHIIKYVVRLNGARVDSVSFFGSDSSVAVLFGPGRDTTIPNSRFHWNDTVWSWYWRSFRPGESYKVELIAYDSSGNVASTIPSIAVAAPPADSMFACDSGWVPVQGVLVSGLSDYCMEEHEHLSGSRIATRVTWAQAVQTCSQAGAELCSEAQWVHACETFPDNPADTATYGAVDVGNGDTLPWLEAHCQLNTGDSVAMVDPTNTDPLCVSGWGVFDMPGRVSEWTRDVYLTNPGAGTPREPGTLAYLGASDLTTQADLGTLHGGSSLILDQPSQILASAQCRERNYPAFSTVDTLKDSLGNVVSTPPAPNPQGISSAWGFRCCKLAP